MVPRSSVLLALAMAGAGACALLFVARVDGEERDAGVRLQMVGPIPKFLSEYRLFRDPAKQIPNDGVLPYDVNSALFADYAAKHRFIWLPPGTTARYDAEDVFSLPVGCVLVKTFSYLYDLRHPEKGERLIETRLLIHKPQGWVPLVYVWNDEQTDARLKVAGGTVDVEWTHYDGSERRNNYIIPNTNQCKSCHNHDKTVVPIGIRARHLNKDYSYSDGKENQLVRWTKTGYLSGAPDPADAPRLAVWDDPASGALDDRARAWLEINCAHCHNPHGPANTSGLDLRFSQRTPVKWGVMKTPVAAGRGAGNRLYDIVPGKPEESIFMFRLESVEPGIMMPELPRRLVDAEGVALIREWIANMDPAQAEAG